jgi:hypothetical protein
MTLENIFRLDRKITELEYLLLRVRLSGCNNLEFILKSVWI